MREGRDVGKALKGRPTWARWVAACALAIATACGAEADPGDSSTHFWRTCSSDSECGSSYQCLCDRCTEPCNDDTTCSAEGAACVAAAALSCAALGNLCAEPSSAAASYTDAAQSNADTGSAASSQPAASAEPTLSSAAGNDEPRDGGPPSDGESTAASSAVEDTSDDAEDASVSIDASAQLPSQSEVPTAFDAGASLSSAWGAPTGLELGLGSSSWSAVTQDAQNNALYVWIERQNASDPVSSLKSVRRTAGAGFGKTQTLTPTDSFVDPPCLKGNPAGSAVAAWSAGEMGNATVWAATFSNGTWSQAAAIGAEAGPVGSMDCAIDDAGNALVAWVQTGGESTQLYASRFAIDGGWEATEIVGTGDGGETYVSLALDAEGNGWAVWNVLDGLTGALWSNRYDASSSWQGAEPLPATPSVRMRHVDVAVGASGAALATWNEIDELGTHEWIMASVFSDIDGWGEAQTLQESDERTEGLRVGVDSEGAALVVWEGFTQSDLGFENRLRFVRYTPGGGFLAPDLIVADGGQLTLSMLRDGRALATWRQPYDPGVDGDIAAAWFDPAMGWDAPAAFSADPEGDSLNASAAVNESGAAVVVWQQINGTQGDLWTVLRQ